MTAALALDRVVVRYGDGPVVVDAVSLSLAPGELLCLLGPSGCGKTTLLRAIGGYLPVADGAIHVDGRDVTRLGPEQRRIGMVFQSYALFPHLSARRNVAFGLEVRGLPRAARAAAVERELRRVALDPSLWDRRPAALSGGQQQRVALARALAIEPSLLLLDEPLANLDRGLRDALRGELRRVQHAAGVAAVLVTHDQDEALALADRVALMRAGRLVQLATPAELYNRPRTPFAARFVGEANLLRVAARDGDLALTDGGLRLAADAASGSWLLLRPEQLTLGPAAAACPTRWDARVEAVVYLGADVRLTLRIGAALLIARTRAAEWRGAVGDTVAIGAGAPWVVPSHDDAEAPATSDGRRDDAPDGIRGGTR
ncbi:MAG: ABC transporter ATP-binding protein [bacterium]